jgi:hypothetical protein
MNYNISNNLNFAQFLPSKPENKNNQTQILLLRTFLFESSHFNSFEAKFSILLIAVEINPTSSELA